MSRFSLRPRTHTIKEAGARLHTVPIQRERGDDMRYTIEQIPQAEIRKQRSWQAFTLDTLLAIGGALLITMIIYVEQWYPAIPNISVVYLLLILPLASWRG